MCPAHFHCPPKRVSPNKRAVCAAWRILLSLCPLVFRHARLCQATALLSRPSLTAAAAAAVYRYTLACLSDSRSIDHGARWCSVARLIVMPGSTPICYASFVLYEYPSPMHGRRRRRPRGRRRGRCRTVTFTLRPLFRALRSS